MICISYPRLSTANELDFHFQFRLQFRKFILNERDHFLSDIVRGLRGNQSNAKVRDRIVENARNST